MPHVDNLTRIRVARYVCIINSCIYTYHESNEFIYRRKYLYSYSAFFFNSDVETLYFLLID